ncbi:hypothetical protein ADUPG1_006230, partial [Aduncisulcus paluster]
MHFDPLSPGHLQAHSNISEINPDQPSFYESVPNLWDSAGYQQGPHIISSSCSSQQYDRLHSSSQKDVDPEYCYPLEFRQGSIISSPHSGSKPHSYMLPSSSAHQHCPPTTSSLSSSGTSSQGQSSGIPFHVSAASSPPISSWSQSSQESIAQHSDRRDQDGNVITLQHEIQLPVSERDSSQILQHEEPVQTGGSCQHHPEMTVPHCAYRNSVGSSSDGLDSDHAIPTPPRPLSHASSTSSISSSTKQMLSLGPKFMLISGGSGGSGISSQPHPLSANSSPRYLSNRFPYETISVDSTSASLHSLPSAADVPFGSSSVSSSVSSIDHHSRASIDGRDQEFGGPQLSYGHCTKQHHSQPSLIPNSSSSSSSSSVPQRFEQASLASGGDYLMRSSPSFRYFPHSQHSSAFYNSSASSQTGVYLARHSSMPLRGEHSM